MFDLVKFIDEKWKWSLATFGPGRRTAGCIAHIEKELNEIRLQPTDLEEWVDVIFLAIDGASRAGYSGEEIVDAFAAKHAVNVKRKWPPQQPEHVAIEHVKDRCPHGYEDWDNCPECCH